MLADVRPFPPVLPAITGERLREGYSVPRSAGRTDCSDCSLRYGETLLRRRSLSATSRYLLADYELRPPRLSRNHFALGVPARKKRRVEIERPSTRAEELAASARRASRRRLNSRAVFSASALEPRASIYSPSSCFLGGASRVSVSVDLIGARAPRDWRHVAPRESPTSVGLSPTRE